MEALKTDLTKSDPAYYKAKTAAEIVALDTYGYLTLSGQSSPDDPKFWNAVESIYTVAYGIKFLCKAEDNDFTVPKMECHWFISGGPAEQHKFTQTPKDLWLWQIKIRMPDMVESDHFFRSIHQSKTKKPDHNFDNIKFEYLKEGICAQILHLGSYNDEAPSISKVHKLIDEEGYRMTGYHKEIYLNDPRRVAPGKLKTILRYQIEKI